LVFSRRADDPAAFALALASLAALGLLLIVGRRLRSVLGVSLVLLGAGMAVAGVSNASVLPAGAGVLIIAAGAVTVIGGRSWADPEARYEARQPVPGRLGSSPDEAWRALDAGFDPTLDGPPDDTTPA
jgi:hypothetical protein